LDRRRPLAAFAVALLAAVAAAVAAAGAAGAADPAAPALREMRWLDPGLPHPEVVRLLATEPAECLRMPADPALQQSIAIGRAVFRTPLLLGGQAARAGVSCASCHRAGHGNRHFAFPGVSGAPGTADVTSSVFSTRRGDGIVNPRPIPDLVADPPRVDRDPAKPDLRRFIRGLVVDEFDGLEPPAAVLDGLAAYVRALGGACGGDVARTADGEAGTALAAVAAAQQQLAVPDPAAAHLLIAAARSALGRLDERFAAVPAIGRLLAQRDTDLRRLQALMVADPAADVAAARQGLDRWSQNFGRDIDALRAASPRSYYAVAALDRVVPPAGGAAPARQAL
jgi:hypothetical protein